MPKHPRKKSSIVFVGCGHAHLYSLIRTRELVRRGFEVTLVDSSPYLYYSGMATGVISGAYAPDEHRIDVCRLVREGGGSFIENRVAEVWAETRELVLETGEIIPYDAASFCLGSEIRENSLTESVARAVPVKPVEHIGEIRRRLLSLDENSAPEVLVVGGGAAGCEVAANTLALFDRQGLHGRLTLAEEGGTLLADAPKKARQEIQDFLIAKGARVLTDTLVTSFDTNAAWTRDRRRIPYDLPIMAVGVSPPALFRESHLPTGDDGGLRVDRYLRSTGDERLFGGGDCISYRGEGLPKLGVFAIRQAPVIFHNLRAVLEGEPLVEYEPQRRFLYILNLGDGTGLATYGPFVWRGRLSWKLKHRIDKKFVEEHRR